MKLMTKTLTLALALTSSLALAACSDDDTDTGGGAGDTGTGGDDGDGTGGATGGSGGGSGGGGGADCKSILEIASETESLSSLVAAVGVAGLESALGGEDLTVFAPTNDAFAALLDALGVDFEDLTADQLTPILTYHVAGSVIMAADALEVAAGAGSFETLGGTVAISGDADAGLVLDADEAAGNIVLELTDIEACNGVVHVIDAVILPSITDVVTTQASFSGLATLIGAAESGDAIALTLDGAAKDADESLDPGGFTLFAPNNAAVDAVDPVPGAAALDDILQYHVYAADNAVLAKDALALSDAPITMLNGDTLTVDGGTGVTLTDTGNDDSSVVITDIHTSNGVIHVIDGVLLPTSITSPT